jgi:hypothetical protein
MSDSFFNPVNYKWEIVTGVKNIANSVLPNMSFDDTGVFNNEGHVGPNFEKNIDLLAVGCSVTAGVGLDHEYTWPYLLAEKLNCNYNVLSFPGKSVGFLVHQIFEYVKKYGKPKRLVVLFPDDNRVHMYGFDIDNLFKYTNKKHVLKTLKKTEIIYKSKEIFSEKDVVLDDFYNIPYVNMIAVEKFRELIIFCDLLDINLYWTSWDLWHNNIAENNLYSDEYTKKTYVKLKNFNGGMFEASPSDTLDCHPEISNRDTFKIARDNNHWGDHYHAHVAEDFYNHITKK